MKARNTIQKSLIMEAVQNLKTHPSAEEIYNEISKRNSTISKATVYRNLSILADKGDILKIELPSGPDRFDFFTEQHYHIKCEKCGRLYDMNLPPVNALENVRDENFIVNGYDLLFKGICKECEEEN